MSQSQASTICGLIVGVGWKGGFWGEAGQGSIAAAPQQVEPCTPECFNAVHRLVPALVMLQIFVPVYDVAGAQEMSSVLWNAPDGEQASPIKVPRLCVRLSAGHQAVPAMHKSRRCCMHRLFLLTGYICWSCHVYTLVRLQKSGFEQVADMALAFAVMGEVDEKREPLGGWPAAVCNLGTADRLQSTESHPAIPLHALGPAASILPLAAC